MFAIAFDLVVAEARTHHPKGEAQAYADIAHTLADYGFRRVQGSLYVTDNRSMTDLFAAVLALRELSWFPKVVRDIRGFRIEDWSDFTPLVKG